MSILPGKPTYHWVLCLVLVVGWLSLFCPGELRSLIDPASVHVDVVEEGRKFHEQSVLKVVGRNNQDTVATVVVQIDDRPSLPYWNRVNIEHQVLPGDFELVVPLGGMKTGIGRAVHPGNILKVTAFRGDFWSSVSLETAKVETPNYLPPGSMGWDFGPDHAAVFPGFHKVSPSTGKVSGKRLTGLQRSAGDALISDGIRGIERFEVEVPNGRYRIALWALDRGEWQTLPYWTRRSIRVNGQPLSEQRKSPETWVENTYLAGSRLEALVDGGRWELLAGRRHGLVTGVVEIVDGMLLVEMDGDLSTARFLAGFLLTPIGQIDALDKVEARRKRLFEAKWPLLYPDPVEDAQAVAVHTSDDPNLNQTVEVLTWRLGKGDGFAKDVWLSDEADSQHVSVTFEMQTDWPESLSLDFRIGRWGFGRATAGGNLLLVHADRLSEMTGTVPVTRGIRRRLNIRAMAGAGTPPGDYTGELLISGLRTDIAIPLTVSVLNLSLPEPERPVGVYLEEAPHLAWFGAFAGRRGQAVSCDLALLRRYGLSAVAPPFSLPRRGFVDRHVDMMDEVFGHGFRGPVLSYASMKWAAKEGGPDKAASMAGSVAGLLSERGRPPILWSLADEPSNHGHGYAPLHHAVATFRRMAPNARIAGHLNNKRDWRILELFDVALVNPGFGVDRQDIETIRGSGVSPWFYNMGKPRVAAGFYLWRAGADGYLQWHARMPTADPYDPTDGREDDFQMLYPALAPCGVQDVHADLLEISNGISDLRWLTWLERRAQTDPESKRLILRLKSSVPPSWRGAEALSAADLNAFRARITGFATAALRSADPQNAVSQ